MPASCLAHANMSTDATIKKRQFSRTPSRRVQLDSMTRKTNCRRKIQVIKISSSHHPQTLPAVRERSSPPSRQEHLAAKKVAVRLSYGRCPSARVTSDRVTSGKNYSKNLPFNFSEWTLRFTFPFSRNDGQIPSNRRVKPGLVPRYTDTRMKQTKENNKNKIIHT